MSPWDGASRWINTLLLVVVGFIGFDTLFRLLEANERNVIVGFTRNVATVLLAPFQGMFDEQEYLLTALIAVLGYALIAGIAMAVIRSVQASTRRRLAREAATARVPGAQAPGARAPGQTPTAWQRSTTDWQRAGQSPPRTGEAGGDTAEMRAPGSPQGGAPWSPPRPVPRTGPEAGWDGEGDTGAGSRRADSTAPLPNGRPRGQAASPTPPRQGRQDQGGS